MGSASFWFEITGLLGLIPLIAAGVSGLVIFRRRPRSFRYLVVLIWFGLTVELVSHLLQSAKRHNLFLGPVYAAGELWLLSLVYGSALQSATFNKLRPWLAGAFVCYVGLSIWLVPQTAQFKPILLVLESVLVLGLVGLYFRKLLSELRVRRLSRDPMFWVSTGLLLYFLGKLQIALFSNYALLHYSTELNLWVWTIHALLLVILHSCYCLALWIRPQN